MPLMFATDYAHKIAEIFGVDAMEALEAINQELEDLADSGVPVHENLMRHASQLAHVSANIEKWLSEGASYDLPETYESISKFCREHRRACVWAVLAAKTKAKEAIDAEQ